MGYTYKKKHLYKKGAKYREEKKFQEEYGKERGKYIYGAVVGKVKRERMAKKKRKSSHHRRKR